MDTKKRKKRNKPKKAYLYGKNSVLERLKTNPSSVKRVYIAGNFSNTYILKKAKENGIPVREVSVKELAKIKRADRLQGIVAEIDKFKYADFSDVFLQNIDNKKFIYVFLDGINDPHNLGAIIRVLACFGDFCAVLPFHNSCGINDTVMHVASGGENYIPIVMVNNLATPLLELKESGYKVVGALPEKGEGVVPLTEIDFCGKTALLIGSEGKGIRKGLRGYIDIPARIPMRGANLSFNVATAMAVFAYHFERLRRRNHRGNGE